MPKIEVVDPDGNLVTIDVRHTHVSSHDGTRKISTRVELPLKEGFSDDPACIAAARGRIAARLKIEQDAARLAAEQDDAA